MGFWFFSVKDVIHHVKKPPRNLVATYELDQNLVGEGLGVAPGTDPYTDTTI